MDYCIDTSVSKKGDYYFFVQDEAEKGIKLSIEDYDEKALVWHNIFCKVLPNKEELPAVDGACRALDIGCNTAYNVKMLEEKYGYAAGIDVNERLIQYSKLNSDNCYIMRAEKLYFHDESFSIITAKDVLEHVQCPDSAINESYRVLADGGYIICMIPLDGEPRGIDDVVVNPAFNFGNESHTWKATLFGVVARMFTAGFTDLEYFVYSHSQLFGEARQFGDRVIVVKAKKKKGITKVPLLWLNDNFYWAAFLTFNCTGDCDYCIQKLCADEFAKAKLDYAKNEISAESWVSFYNSLQKFKIHKLGIIGGEPTVHKGFFDIVNGIKGYYKTVTSNLKTSLFDDISKFCNSIEDISSIRINTSFHPKIISIDEFCNKVHQLRDCGIFIDQIAMVDHPTSNFSYYYNEFIKRGLVLNPQTYLGKFDKVLLPNPESNLTRDYKEHGINDFNLYREGFSCEEKQQVLCMTRRFMVAPDGGIYKCHYHLYSKRNCLGNILDNTLPKMDDYVSCADFGFCNPCDFPHAKFKSITVNLEQEIFNITGDKIIASDLTNLFNDNLDVLQELLDSVFIRLYQSNDPYWLLYNDDSIRKAINGFIMTSSVGEAMIDNTNARILAQLDGSLFRWLPSGINVFRLLDEIPLCKYIDALGDILYTVIEYFPILKEKLPTLGHTKSFDTTIASLLVSLSTINFFSGAFYIWKEEKDEQR